MITRHRYTNLPSKQKLVRHINLFRGIRKLLAREQQQSPPSNLLNELRGQADEGCE